MFSNMFLQKKFKTLNFFIRIDLYTRIFQNCFFRFFFGSKFIFNLPWLLVELLD